MAPPPHTHPCAVTRILTHTVPLSHTHAYTSPHHMHVHTDAHSHTLPPTHTHTHTLPPLAWSWLLQGSSWRLVEVGRAVDEPRFSTWQVNVLGWVKGLAGFGV